MAAAYGKDTGLMVAKEGNSPEWSRLSCSLCEMLEADMHEKEVFSIEDECGG
jgi:hypothetical protein